MLQRYSSPVIRLCFDTSPVPLSAEVRGPHIVEADSHANNSEFKFFPAGQTVGDVRKRALVIQDRFVLRRRYGSMRCSKCGTESKTGKKFCAACGSPISNRCPKCGAENAPSSAFCEDCGTALAPNTAPSTSSPRRSAFDVRVAAESSSGYLTQPWRNDISVRWEESEQCVDQSVCW